MNRVIPWMGLLLSALLLTITAVLSFAVAEPAPAPASDLAGRYEMVYHWNRLDWNFADPRMKQQFEAKKFWKHAMPAGVKVDSQGTYYVSVPRWAQGIPSTMNKIVVKDGKPLLEPFPSWDWNKAGDVRVLQSYWAMKSTSGTGCGCWTKGRSLMLRHPPARRSWSFGI